MRYFRRISNVLRSFEIEKIESYESSEKNRDWQEKWSIGSTSLEKEVNVKFFIEELILEEYELILISSSERRYKLSENPIKKVKFNIQKETIVSESFPVHFLLMEDYPYDFTFSSWQMRNNEVLFLENHEAPYKGEMLGSEYKWVAESIRKIK